MFIITFIWGIYIYIPETSYVSRVYNVADLVYLQFVLCVMLFRMLNTFCTCTSVLPKVCVQCPIWLIFVVP